MASYRRIKEIFNGSTTFPVTDKQGPIHRQNSYPLDTTEVFESFEKAQQYANDEIESTIQDSGLAYVGQKITVVNESAKTADTYMITDDDGTLEKFAITNSPALTGIPTAPTAIKNTNTTQIATTAFVVTEVNDKIATADAMIYKGSIAGGSTSSYGALTSAASRGWTYKVSEAGKINGKVVEVGDMLICNTDNTAAATASNYETIAANWDIIQGNIDGAVIGPVTSNNENIAVFNGTNGKIIKDSGFTIAKSVPADAKFTDTTYSEVTTTAAGLMSADDKSKLDGIATGANKTVVDSTLSNTSTNPVQNKVINSALATKASTNIATTSTAGLMSADDKTKIDNIQVSGISVVSQVPATPVQNVIYFVTES